MRKTPSPLHTLSCTDRLHGILFIAALQTVGGQYRVNGQKDNIKPAIVLIDLLKRGSEVNMSRFSGTAITTAADLYVSLLSPSPRRTTADGMPTPPSTTVASRDKFTSAREPGLVEMTISAVAIINILRFQEYSLTETTFLPWSGLAVSESKTSRTSFQTFFRLVMSVSEAGSLCGSITTPSFSPSKAHLTEMEK